VAQMDLALNMNISTPPSEPVTGDLCLIFSTKSQIQNIDFADEWGRNVGPSGRQSARGSNVQNDVSCLFATDRQPPRCRANTSHWRNLRRSSTLMCYRFAETASHLVTEERISGNSPMEGCTSVVSGLRLVFTTFIPRSGRSVTELTLLVSRIADLSGRGVSAHNPRGTGACDELPCSA
jgi:hypothetical protein